WRRRRMARSCSIMPASSDLKASFRNGRTLGTGRGGHRTGSRACAAHVACKDRALEIPALVADDAPVVQIAEAAAFNAVEHAFDFPAMPYAEIDRTAGRIVAEHCRGGPAIDLDPAVGMWVGQVGAGEPVGTSGSNREAESTDA